MRVFLWMILICASLPAQDAAEYSRKIREYTTRPDFLTQLISTLPTSASVPSPDKVLGFVPGEPGKLAKVSQIHSYFQALASASPQRVRTWNIGMSEEGRDTLLVAISSEKNLSRLGRLKEITSKLADPRKLSEAEAQHLIHEGVPVYWVTAAIHSTEMGAPSMLMELAYRLAVDERPFIQNIRDNMIVMITPIVEVDGWDRNVELHDWKKENPHRQAPGLLYWGRYVTHDNNRDGLSLSLNLSRIIAKTFLDWHPQVLHDLHESVPYLYTSTGMGPYNAWVDPIVINEWQKLAYHEVEGMTRRGVPGVWTQGFYDGWAANYMFWTANTHNSIGRFYETFGNGGADTRERILNSSQTSRTWYRPNPPFEKVLWSYRNNINLQQSALLLAMNYTARNKTEFLENFYLKSRRSIEKATKEGPAAWVISSDHPRQSAAAELVNLFSTHGAETHILDQDVSVNNVRLPKGSYVLRMDQPYSRLIDMMLDQQFYKADDTRPYDDTGWTAGPLRNIPTHRITDPEFLKQPMTILFGKARAPGGVVGNGDVFVVNHTAESILATFRYELKDVQMFAAEEAFEAAGQKFNIGSFLIPADHDLRTRLHQTGQNLGVRIFGIQQMPAVSKHPLKAARVALVHSWLSTQTEGWFRIALDQAGIPYDYISDQKLREISDLGSRWDVILFGPTPGSSQRIVNGIPAHGPDPIPFLKSKLTPSFGLAPDQSEDIRRGMELEGLLNLRKFVDAGGIFITIGSNASIPIDYGLVDSVSIQPTPGLNAKGSILQAVFADRKSPVSYGYDEKLAVYFNQAPAFSTSTLSGMPDSTASSTPQENRVTGRGSLTDPDIVQGRLLSPSITGNPPEISEAMQTFRIPKANQPRVILKFAPEKELLISGMLAGGKELAERPAIIDIPQGKGHFIFFANNPMWRQQTQGSFFLLFNIFFNAENLNAGRNSDVILK